MRRNRLRELLKNDQPTLGTRVLSSWPTIIELVGHSGMFDYVEFCGEYAPYDHVTLENMGRAIELFDYLSGMIKIEQESRRRRRCVRSALAFKVSCLPTLARLMKSNSAYAVFAQNARSRGAGKASTCTVPPWWTRAVKRGPMRWTTSLSP